MVCPHRWTGTQQQRHPPLPTWAGFKLAAEREKETILYRYLSPCFPFVTTPSLCKTEKHTGALQSPRAELGPVRAGASLAESHEQTSCHFPQAQTGSNAKGKSSGNGKTLFPSSIPASAGRDVVADRLSPGGRTMLLVVHHPHPRDPAVPPNHFYQEHIL